MTEKGIKSIIGSVVALVLLLILWPIAIINSGNVGLKFTTGALDDKVLEEGIHFRTPLFQKVREITVRPIQVDYTVEVGEDGAISKDNQTIGSDLTVFYKYDKGRVVEMWRIFGEDNIKSIVVQTLKENFKKTLGAYDIMQIAESQEKIRAEVFEKTKSDLAVKNYPIELVEVKITNYNWSDAYDKMIEETMQRKQEVKKKEQELLITEQETLKQVKQAEAEKQSNILRAEGEKEAASLRADAKALEGEGIKKYNSSVAQNWDIEIRKLELEIEKMRVERWNGFLVPSQVFTPIPLNLEGNMQDFDIVNRK